ncbi:MAG: cytochrome P450 [Acidimicrobiales bacterium]|nr:cytochrome P450 [Acidimicrobiales bacterium]MCB9392386.1 cytochrome P450 [Acidimicrobiaceae bacterium]
MERRTDRTGPDVDIVSHDVYAAGLPFAAYNRLRAEAPVAWTDLGPHNGHHGRGFWSLTRWADVVEVHKDWRTFSSEVGGTEIEDLDPDAIVARRTMLETDPPRHARLRQLVNPAFSKLAMERHATTAERLVSGLFAANVGVGEVDAVTALARELPIRMLVDILGVPHADAPQLFHWADQIVYNADPDHVADEVGDVSDRVDTDPFRLLPFRSPVSLKVFEHMERLAAARRTDPAADVITVLADAVVDGVPLTERERGTFLLLLLIAGNETTRHSLTHGLIALAEHPDQFDRLRAEPDLATSPLLDTAVEEVLRWACPQIHFRRTATVDTEIGGRPIRAGDKVVTWYVAANTDPAQFDDPYRFDLARTPNRHVTFGGGGPHLCLGQWMARLEVRVFLQALASSVSRIEVTGPVERVRSNFINGVKRCPVVLHPA